MSYHALPVLRTVALFASFAVFPKITHAQIPAFPGAEGYGAYAKGGRGGDVYHVTNLNGSGAGSFADAIGTVPTAGRTIVFDVSGHIHVNKTTLSKSNVTIAGQTAPGDGIGFRDGTFIISGDDIVIRHARFRYGKKAAGGDCIDLSSGTLNAILDQISIQFSTDENISSFSSPPENLTMQWSLNGWGLESHSCGGLWDQNHATSHHSLWAHNHTRNPKARPNGLLDWVNNITFDWDIGFIMGDSNTPASWKANVRGCYFLCPPGNLRSKALEKANLDRNGAPNFSLFLENCLHDNDGDGLLNGTNKGYAIASGSYTTSPTAFPATGALPVTIDTPLVAFKKIVSKAGALRLDVSYAGPLRDEVDAKMISNVVTQTRQHISTETALGVSNAGFGTLNSATTPTDTDRDGMPDNYETALGWNPAVQDHNTALANSGGLITGATFFPTGTVAGYTRLEEYLQFLAIPHGTVAKNVTGTPTSLAVNMAKFTSGFSASPVFTVSNVTGGTISVAGNIATFTPTLNYTGRARFDFTVTDAAGSSWTQTCAILVTTSGVPRDLKWIGGLNANAWDLVTNNWAKDSTATAFSGGDTVRFDDSGSLSPAVNVVGTANTPGGVTVQAAGNYTFSGTGSLFSPGALTKRGTGSLTLSNSGNSFASVVLDEGTLSLPIGFSNAPAMLLNGGTLAFATSLDEPVTVNGTVALNPSGLREFTGAFAGTGTANFNIGNNTFTMHASMSAFEGTVALGASTGFFRLYGSLGSALATFDLGTSTADLLNRDGNATIELGALTGGSGTALSGASATTNPTTYRIGGNGVSTTFAGAIVNGLGSTAITKIQAGTLTLTGTSSYTGATTVSGGDLIVNGVLGNTATTIASGAKLRGSGAIGGAVTAQAGSQISPGAGPGLVGTLSVGAGLTLENTTLSIQLSGTPAGVNDRIAMNGGALTFTGTTTLTIALNDGVLGAGAYELINGGASTVGGIANLAFTPPNNGRQTFALSTPPGKLVLNVTGNPATLRWLGTTGAWDTTAANWANTSSGANPDAFVLGDAVLFDDTAANGAVTLAAPVSPRAMTVTNTSRAFTFSGAAISTSGSLVKSGTGTLTLNDANGFASVVQNAGTIALGTAAANAGGLGAGIVTLNGGTLKMFSAGDGTHAGTLPNALNVTGNATFQLAPRGGFSGAVIGAGTLNYFTTFVRADVSGDWSDFAGTVNVTTDAGGGDFRITSNYSWPGLPLATVNLNANTWFYFAGILNSGAGTTIELGELTGAAGSHLRGGPTGGRGLTYRIGAKTPPGTEAVFAGVVEEQNTNTSTSIVKAGGGTWTVSGTSFWNGGTTIEAGILKITGAVTSGAATNVATGATLSLNDGEISTEALKVAPGASLAAYGAASITGDLNNDGSLTVFGSALSLAGDFVNTGTVEMRPGSAFIASGEIVNDGTMRFQTGSTLSAAGAFTNNGTLDLLTSASSLPGNFVNNGTVILNTERRILSATKTGASFSCSAWGYTAHTYQLQRADSLAGPWASIGGILVGAGAMLTFTDNGGAIGAARFYRLNVGP